MGLEKSGHAWVVTESTDGNYWSSADIRSKDAQRVRQGRKRLEVAEDWSGLSTAWVWTRDAPLVVFALFFRVPLFFQARQLWSLCKFSRG